MRLKSRLIGGAFALVIAVALCCVLSLLVSAYYEKINGSALESMRVQLSGFPVAKGDYETGKLRVFNHGGPVGVSRHFSSSRSAGQIIGYYIAMMGPLGWKVAEQSGSGERRRQLTLCKAGVSLDVATVPVYEKTGYTISLSQYPAHDASDRCSSPH